MSLGPPITVISWFAFGIGTKSSFTLNNIPFFILITSVGLTCVTAVVLAWGIACLQGF